MKFGADIKTLKELMKVVIFMNKQLHTFSQSFKEKTQSKKSKTHNRGKSTGKP
jgi:hypothetical protein